MSNYLRLKKMLYVVSLAAVSIVLSLIEITWPVPGFQFLKIDFSEVAILIALLVLGTRETFIVVLIRAFARRLFRGFAPDELVGELLAVFASLAIIFGYSLAKRVLKDRSRPLFYEVSINGNKVHLKEMIVYTSIITLSLSVTLWAVNFLFATPFYFSYFTGDIHFSVFTWIPNDQFPNIGSFLWFTIAGYFPFNLTKGILVTIIFMLIKPRMKYLEL
jgi:riboflavin transporter FmnP